MTFLSHSHEAREQSDDGRADFDFLFGEWQVTPAGPMDALDPACEELDDFVMRQVAQPLLGGMGNTDSCETVVGAGRSAVHRAERAAVRPRGAVVAHLVGVQPQPRSPRPAAGRPVRRRDRCLPGP